MIIFISWQMYFLSYAMLTVSYYLLLFFSFAGRTGKLFRRLGFSFTGKQQGAEKPAEQTVAHRSGAEALQEELSAYFDGLSLSGGDADWASDLSAIIHKYPPLDEPGKESVKSILRQLYWQYAGSDIRESQLETFFR